MPESAFFAPKPGNPLTPEQLNKAIVSALRALANSGVFAEEEIPSEVVVERPKNRDHGDWATNVAMQLAGKLARTQGSLLSSC